MKKRERDVIVVEYESSLEARDVRKSCKKTKILHWINGSQSVAFPITIYERLLTSTEEINPKSKTEYK